MSPLSLLCVIRGVLDFSGIDWPLHQSRWDGTDDLANQRLEEAGFGAWLLGCCLGSPWRWESRLWSPSLPRITLNEFAINSLTYITASNLPSSVSASSVEHLTSKGHVFIHFGLDGHRLCSFSSFIGVKCDCRSG